MNKETLSIVWFPDSTLWEADFVSQLAEELGKHGAVNLFRVSSSGHVPSEGMGKRVWLVAHDWKLAHKKMAKQLRGREVYASILGLPAEKGSLFTLLWRRLFFGNPERVRLFAHSPINFRFYREIEGWQANRLHYLPFGMVAGRKPRKPNPDGRLVIGSFARLSPESNYNFLLSVAHYVVQKRPDTIFRLLGSGELYPHLVQSVRELGLESRVEIVETEFTDFVSSLDVMLYPPVRNDHFYILNEAATYATPVVSVDLPGVKDFIVDGKSGFIVPQYETKSMAELTIRLIDHEALRTSIGQEFYKTLAVKYSPPAVADEYLQVFANRRSVVKTDKAA